MGPFKRFPDLSPVFLKEEPGHTGSSVDGGKDEKRFKHDGKVVPERHQRAHARDAGEDLRKPHGKRDCPTWTAGNNLPHFPGQFSKIDGMHSKRSKLLRSQIDGGVVGGFQRAGRNEGDDPDHSLHQHRTVANHPRIGFFIEHLRSRPGGDERMVS